jgi:hypothetical protein
MLYLRITSLNKGCGRRGLEDGLSFGALGGSVLSFTDWELLRDTGDASGNFKIAVVNIAQPPARSSILYIQQDPNDI